MQQGRLSGFAFAKQHQWHIFAVVEQPTQHFHHVICKISTVQVSRIAVVEICADFLNFKTPFKHRICAKKLSENVFCFKFIQADFFITHKQVEVKRGAEFAFACSIFFIQYPFLIIFFFVPPGVELYLFDDFFQNFVCVWGQGEL